MQAQDGDPDSTLTLYRRALALRHELQSDEELTWVDTGRPDVLWFTRPNGWAVVTNFGREPFELDSADLVLASADAPLGVVPGETTVWLAPAEAARAALTAKDGCRAPTRLSGRGIHAPGGAGQPDG